MTKSAIDISACSLGHGQRFLPAEPAKPMRNLLSGRRLNGKADESPRDGLPDAEDDEKKQQKNPDAIPERLNSDFALVRNLA